jgi:hypothetical protein
MPRKPFRLPERIVTLVFEDGPYVGLEIDVSLTAPQSLFWTLAAQIASSEERPEDKELTATDITQLRDLALLWGGQIRSWNLQDHDGTPVPATPDGFADRLDRMTQAVLIARWLAAVRNPPAPLSPGPRKRRTSARS